MIGAIGPFTQRAIERLRLGRPGEVITDEEMSNVLGRDCTAANGANNVRTAIRRVKLDHGVWWERIRGEGYWRCLDDREKVDSGERRVRLTARQARRIAAETTTIDVSRLDEQARLDFHLNQIQAGLMFTSGGSAMRKRLQKTKTIEQLRQPELPRLIDLMSNGGGRDRST